MSSIYLPNFGVESMYISETICDAETYAAVIDGTIRSCAKSPFWPILNTQTKPNGYDTVTLYKDGVKKTWMVHLLILKTFKGECPHKMQGCHGPLGKSNNTLDNLYYGTLFTNNYEDKHRDGTMLTGENHPNFNTTHIAPNASLSDDEVRLIRKLYKEGYSIMDLERKFRISHKSINGIISRRLYKHVN